MNTAFGTRHENEAIAVYERRTGTVVRSTNEHLLIWRFPRDRSMAPAPLERVPLRPRRDVPTSPREQRSGAGSRSCCSGDERCGCNLLRAIDRARAAVAVERGEVRWFIRLLQLLDPTVAEEDYIVRRDWSLFPGIPCETNARSDGGRGADGVTGVWDAAGLMSDLRVARGRHLFTALRFASTGSCASETDRPPSPTTPRLPAAPRLSDYLHGADRWDLDGLRSDLAIVRLRLAAARTARASCCACEETPTRTRAPAAGATAQDGRPAASVEGEHGCHDGCSVQRGCHFYLCGAVDGISDEAVPPQDGEPEDAWRMRDVVLEVKNRVNGIKTPPPFYDLVQLTTYCLMLGMEVGNLVQCARAKQGSTIHITRIEMSEEPMRHADNWHAHVLPALYAFADAVHRMRASTRLRHTYLVGGIEQRRRALAREVPHLSAILLRA